MKYDYQEEILKILMVKKGRINNFALQKLCGVYSFSEASDINDAKRDFEIAYKKLIKQRIIIEINDECFYNDPKNHLIYETLRYANGKYYVIYGGHIIEIKNVIESNAIERDIVAVKLNSHNIGTIDSICYRKDRKIILYAIEENNEIKLVPKNCTLNLNIKSNNVDIIPGDIYIANIDEIGNCIVKERIGNVHDLNYETKLIAAKHDIKIGFSQKAMDETLLIPKTVEQSDFIGRRDQRDREIFTIDGKTAKDFDDGISCYKKENGNYVLGVHIMDVAHYIKPGSELWKEALEKGNSSYFGSYVEPMLPFILSNGICSLNPHQDRLVVTREIEYTKEGKIINEETFLDVVNSKKRMYYHEVNTILDEGQMIEGYEPFIKTLYTMKELSDILEVLELKRGSINFNTETVEYENDEYGNPYNLRKDVMGTSERIIRNFMIAGNESIINELLNKNLPAVYRIHEQPDEKAIAMIIEVLEEANIFIKPPRDISNKHEMQKFFNKILEYDNSSELCELIIQKMFRAKYSAYNIGHFCLALKAYAHFTSPIRRFADLLLMTLVKHYMKNPIIEDPEIIEESIEKICLHISKKQKQTDEAEREIRKFEIAKHFANNKDNNFEAKITYISHNYLTIKINDMISYSIDLNKFFNKAYRYDDREKCIIYRGEKFYIGSLILVKPCEIYLEDAHISFRFKQSIIKEKDKVMSLA